MKKNHSFTVLFPRVYTCFFYSFLAFLVLGIETQCQGQVGEPSANDKVVVLDSTLIEKIRPSKIVKTVRKTPDDIYEFINPLNNEVVKRLSQEQLASEDPMWNASYPLVSSNNNKGSRYKFFDLSQLPIRKRQSLVKKVKKNPSLEDSAETSEINYINLMSNFVYPFQNGIIVKHVTPYCQYEHCEIPVGYQTRFIRYDSAGLKNATWMDSLQYYGVDLSHDGRFILTNSTFSAGEDKEIFGDWALVDMNTERKLPIPYMLKAASGYEITRGILVRGKYFILPMSSESSVLWLIIDPYERLYYTRIFEALTEKDFKYYSQNLYDEVFFNGISRTQVNFSGFVKHLF
ncbi:MAG: hypothetical protein SH818_19835 [Saprospiraceae bacterium]|nr:hypothetical protein [Saprospiraceae bacterium]